MKYNILLGFLVLSFQLGYSQTEKRIKASVINNDFALQGIEVVNLNNKNVTITNNEGLFSILAKAGDQLMFISKKYEYKTITLQEVNFLNTDFVIHLIKKPEELGEVVITKFNAPKFKIDKASFNQAYIERLARTPKVIGVYDGQIENGANIIAILSMGWRLFVKPHKKTIESQIHFKDLTKNKLKEDFFTKELKLKTDQIALFLEFCDADPKSKNIIENPNVLSLMDFLFAKNEEFKKLQSIN